MEGCPGCLAAAEQNAELGEALIAQQKIARDERLGRMRAERRLADLREADPDAPQIKRVLARWRDLTGHKRAICPPAGKRWSAVKHALRDHTERQILEAIEGIAFFPYVNGEGRSQTGTKKQRYDDIELALRDEVYIQRFRQLRERVLGSSLDEIREMYEHADATRLAYWREWLRKHETERQAKAEYHAILQASIGEVTT